MMTETKTPSSHGLHQLLADIYATELASISCSLAHRLIGLAADHHLDDAAARAQYPDLFPHLTTCADCASCYRLVTEYARLEASGDLPTPPFIPPLPPALHQAKGGWIDRLVRVLFPGFPSTAPSLALRGRLDTAPATVALGDEGLQAELQVQSSSTGANLRTLHCSFTQTRASGDLSHSTVTATLALEATDEEEQTLDSDLATGVTFLDIEPDLYRLILTIDDQEYVIEQIAIP